MDRKGFFKHLANLAIGKGIDILESTPFVKFLEPKVRPPGAIEDDYIFLKVCTGCDACMKACPVNVIMIDDLNKRDPVIYPKDPCIQCPGFPCIDSCPTGALNFSSLNLPIYDIFSDIADVAKR